MADEGKDDIDNDNIANNRNINIGNTNDMLDEAIIVVNNRGCGNNAKNKKIYVIMAILLRVITAIYL